MTAPKKRGRPSIWDGPEGERLAHAVHDLQVSRRWALLPPMSRAWAIKEVLRRDEFASFRKYENRNLQKRILQAAGSWNPWRRLEKEFRKAAEEYGAPNFWNTK
jgi:hypothetical protein